MMDITLLLAGLQSHPQVQLLVSSIQPYMPVIMREGEDFYEDFISYAVKGKWTELDDAVWSKMTEEERDKLSNEVLIEARKAVDNQFRRNELAKEAAFKVATSLIKTMLNS